MDFKNFATDTGFYTKAAGELNWFNGGDLNSAAGLVTAATPVHLVLTRDGTSGDVALCADGVLALSFNDAAALTVFSEAGEVIRLMKDNVTGAPANDENPTGFLDYVRTYSDVATAADALALSNAGVSSVPVPAALPLLAGALGGLAFLRRRKG